MVVPGQTSLSFAYLALAASLLQVRGEGALLLPVVAPHVHAFFYLWYGNPQTDGRYLHWDHEVLPHWTKATRDRYPHGHKHNVEAGEIHSPFFPARGTYSSNDAATLDDQMRELKRAGIGTVILSWWGQASREGTSDTQGVQTDHTIANVIAAVERAGDMFWGVHMEPYPGRTADTVREDVQYLIERSVCASSWLLSRYIY